jgi:hypothetical protein
MFQSPTGKESDKASEFNQNQLQLDSELLHSLNQSKAINKMLGIPDGEEGAHSPLTETPSLDQLGDKLMPPSSEKERKRSKFSKLKDNHSPSVQDSKVTGEIRIEPEELVRPSFNKNLQLESNLFKVFSSINHNGYSRRQN